MNNPRIEIDQRKIRQNTQTLARQLKLRGLNITGVTKAVCGHPAIAQAMLDGGAVGLAEARLSNAQRLRKAGLTGPITLIRSPMLSQADQVVQVCEASYNTEVSVITALAAAAVRHHIVHNIILMVEMGDMREGILPDALSAMAQQVVNMPGVALKGIGANFACLSGVAPDATQMATLSAFATETERACGRVLQTVSGGNSANLPWALGGHAIGRINNLRLGEAILLGVDPVSGDHIRGLHTDAFTLVAEVIEIGTKPVPQPTKRPIITHDQKSGRLILALGQQDTDIMGLSMSAGHKLIGATSDHLVLWRATYDDQSRFRVEVSDELQRVDARHGRARY